MNPDEDGPKRVVQARLVKVLRHRRTNRSMTLEPHVSRCVRIGDVHELVTTEHRGTEPGSRIDRVGFLGFAEFMGGGVIDRGDLFWAGSVLVGTVLGFDAFHYPNHCTILVHATRTTTGAELGLRPEVPIEIIQDNRNNHSGS